MRTHQYIFKIMVYDTNTLKPLHELTQNGKEIHKHMMDIVADEILFKHKHPIRYWWQKLRNLLKTGDFEWTGVDYAEQEKYKDGFSYSNFNSK